jgi:2'-5' RNA ligase
VSERSARLFVALDLPAPALDALVAWRRPPLARDPALRGVAREGLHVTLCFLGDRPEPAIAPLGEAVEACAARAGSLSGLALGAPLWLPRRRPRVLAVAIDDRHGQLGALQARLMELLGARALYAPDPAEATRPYLPHVTVARVRSREPVGRAALPDPPALAFDGAAIVLYRSRLGQAGARYEAQARVAL